MTDGAAHVALSSLFSKWFPIISRN